MGTLSMRPEPKAGDLVTLRSDSDVMTVGVVISDARLGRVAICYFHDSDDADMPIKMFEIALGALEVEEDE